MIEKILSLLSTSVYAASCQPGTNGFNLFDCLVLNSGGDTVKEQYNDPATLVNVIVNNVFVIAGILLFAMVIFAGFKFAMSGKSAAKEDSKNILEAVGIGFLVMFSAYWIIKIVEAVTGVTIFL